MTAVGDREVTTDTPTSWSVRMLARLSRRLIALEIRVARLERRMDAIDGGAR